MTLRKAIEAGLPFVDEVCRDQPLNEARIRMTLGASFACRGEAKIAAEQQEKAHSSFLQHRGSAEPDTLQCSTELASSYQALGRLSEALRLREETLALSWLRKALAAGYTYVELINSDRHLDSLRDRQDSKGLMAEAKAGRR